MPYEPKRNSAGAQEKVQSWDVAVKDVEGGTVFLGFGENVFRKHFVLKSKKATPTPQATKIEHKAINRFLAGVLGTAARSNPDYNPTSRSRSSYKGKYTDGVPTNTMVDLERHDIDSALAEICTQLLKYDNDNACQDNEKMNVTVVFSKPCVVVSTIAATGDTLDYKPAAPVATLNIGAVKQAGGKPSYVIMHCTA